ncbi:MAG TPA: metallophosphoesterase [Thermoleophilia bacterium]|jgi:Icc protein|nr:metallophosphoesterase [Thermoleophilia bacterium]
MITVVQVSDVHIGNSDPGEERARRVFARLASLAEPIDAVLVTGDIADHGAPGEYEIARELFASLPVPVVSCPGNHDDRAAYAKILLGRQESDGPINQVAAIDGAVFALCDSTVPGENGGYLADETLAWLDRVLSDAPGGVPVFVAFHHPPVELHSPFIDGVRQTGSERLAQVLAAHRNVAAIFCGHAHTAAATTFAGLPLLVSPSVISTLTLPWEGDGIVDYEPPAALAFHVLDDAGRLTTHFRAVL